MDLCGTIALFIRKKDGWDLLFQLIISVFYSYQRVVFIRIIDTFRDSNNRHHKETVQILHHFSIN